jgi:hypothetical protein
VFILTPTLTTHDLSLLFRTGSPTPVGCQRVWKGATAEFFTEADCECACRHVHASELEQWRACGACRSVCDTSREVCSAAGVRG